VYSAERAEGYFEAADPRRAYDLLRCPTPTSSPLLELRLPFLKRTLLGIAASQRKGVGEDRCGSKEKETYVTLRGRRRSPVTSRAAVIAAMKVVCLATGKGYRVRRRMAYTCSDIASQPTASSRNTSRSKRR